MDLMSDQQYMQTHQQLRGFWEHDADLFSHLTYQEQRDLHDYFRPSKSPTIDELLAHRDEIGKTRPELAERAEAAAERFNVLVERTPTIRERAHQMALSPPPKKHVRQKDREIVTRPLVRPDVEVEKLARAFISLAYQRTREANKAHDDDRE